MSNILHFDIQQNAILSSLPYLTSWIFGIFCSIYADWLIEHNYISQKNSFKLWNSVASIVPSLGLIGIGVAGCDRIWVMIMLVGFGAFTGANYAGTQMNHIFLAPRYAGKSLFYIKEFDLIASRHSRYTLWNHKWCWQPLRVPRSLLHRIDD